MNTVAWIGIAVVIVGIPLLLFVSCAIGKWEENMITKPMTDEEMEYCRKIVIET